jgi:cytoskeletal protein CcmA (bactofilin family)
MGLFSTTQPSNGSAARPRRSGPQQALSIVAADLVVSGDLQAEGVIRIEGRVAGNVISGLQILLSEGAVVEGDLRTPEAVLGGEVHGNVICTDRVEVQATAAVHGDIITPRLLIQEGAKVNGGVRMETATEVAAL